MKSLLSQMLAQQCVALKVNIPGFDYISNTSHHGWTPVRVQRLGAKGSEFDATFLEECDEVSFLKVGGCLGAKVHSSQVTFLEHPSFYNNSLKD